MVESFISSDMEKIAGRYWDFKNKNPQLAEDVNTVEDGPRLGPILTYNFMENEHLTDFICNLIN